MLLEQHSYLRMGLINCAALLGHQTCHLGNLSIYYDSALMEGQLLTLERARWLLGQHQNS